MKTTTKSKNSVTKPSKIIPYVHSGRRRRANDFYPTLDTRAVDAMIYHMLRKFDVIVDMCAPEGSGIVDHLIAKGYSAFGVGDAFCDSSEFKDASWGVTNPPYKIPLVDNILNAQIARVRRYELKGFAALLRANFDFAATREDMFEKCPCYFGEIKIRARLWWTEDREEGPIHNFTWHIWRPGKWEIKRKLWYTPPYDPKYAVKKKKKDGE